MESKGLSEIFTWQQMRELTSVHVEKRELGWRAKLVIVDRKELLRVLTTLRQFYNEKGIETPNDESRKVYTMWLEQQMKKPPFFSCDAENPVDAKCAAIAMFMYGARPAECVAIDIIRKAAPKMLDCVTGITGENTLILASDVNGCSIPFSLPSAGYLPYTFPTVISKLCANSGLGTCNICDLKRKSRFVFGKIYECGHFVHDYCALENYHSNAGEHRQKQWHFFCGCGAKCLYSSPSKLFNPIRLTVMTGDNVSALKKTIEKYKINGENYKGNVDGDELVKGIRCMLTNVGLKRHQKQVPNLMDPANFLMDMPEKSKAGAFLQTSVHEFIMNGETRKNKQSPSKTEISVIAGAYLKTFIATLQEEFTEFINGSAQLNGMKLQEFTWKRLFVYKVNTKVEAIYAEEITGEKIRCFFPAHVCKFMLDTLLWKPLVNSLYNKGSVMLGHQWVHGGAAKLFHKLRNYNKIFAWDIKGLDSSMKPRIIQLIFNNLFHAYDPKSVESDVYNLFKLLYCIAVGHYVSKVVAWIDEFRILVGAMASGELMTSIFNTLYCIVAVFCWIHHIADLKFGKPMKNAHKVEFIRENVDRICLYIFGDDGLMGTDAFELDLFADVVENGITYPSLDSYLKVHWFMSVKVEESAMVPTTAHGLLSVPDANGDLPAGSISILKRGFVEIDYKGTRHIGPYKSTSISVGKLVKSEVSFKNRNDALYINYLTMCRAIGHAVDTCGTNTIMYDVCKYVYDFSFSEFVLQWNTGGELKFDPHSEMKQVLEDRLFRTFGTAPIPIGNFGVTSFPLRENILEMFLPIRYTVEEDLTDWEMSRLRKPRWSEFDMDLREVFKSLF